MEPEYFSPFDLKAAFVGHPIVETKVDNAEGLVFREANEIPQDKKTLGLFLVAAKANSIISAKT